MIRAKLLRKLASATKRHDKWAKRVSRLERRIAQDTGHLVVAAPVESNKTVPSDDSSLPAIEPINFTRVTEYVGLCSRVAAQTGRTPSHVRQVVKGNRTSSLIQEAVKAEVRRIESLAAAGVDLG